MQHNTVEYHELIIKNSEVFQKSSKDITHGISKRFYPKWAGWKLQDPLEIQEAAREFYSAFFWYRYKLDLLDNGKLAELLFNFLTLEGANKTLSKLNNVLGTTYSSFSVELMEQLNSVPKVAVNLLILEMIEFYHFVGRLDNIGWLLRIYNMKLPSRG